MEFLVLALLARRQRCTGGIDRPVTEYRPLPIYHAHIRVELHQELHFRRHLFAVGAVVIEKLHHRNVAIRVADHRRVGIPFQHQPLIGENLLGRGARRLFLLRLKYGDRIHDDLRVFENRLKREAFDIGRGKLLRESSAGSQRDRCRQKQGPKRFHVNHHSIVRLRFAPPELPAGAGARLTL